MNEASIYGSLFAVLKYVSVLAVPFVEPQAAGIFGGLAYLIVRHELNLDFSNKSSFLVVMFLSWIGAWITVNYLGVYHPEINHFWEHVLSASLGFLSYDILMAIGSNTKSIVGFFTSILKSIILKAVKQWK